MSSSSTPQIVDGRVVVPLDLNPTAPPLSARGLPLAMPSKIESLEPPKKDGCCPSCALIWKQIKAGFQAAGEALERFFAAVHKFFKRLFGIETPKERLADHLQDPVGKGAPEQTLEFFKRLSDAQKREIAVAAWRAHQASTLDAFDFVDRDPDSEVVDADAALLLVGANPELLFCEEVNALLTPPAPIPSGAAK
jgi:hypothetical protein